MNIETEIQKEILKRAIKKIDVEGLSEKILPKIEKEILQNVERAISEVDWENVIYDAIPNKILQDLMKETFLKLFTKEKK